MLWTKSNLAFVMQHSKGRSVNRTARTERVTVGEHFDSECKAACDGVLDSQGALQRERTEC